MILLILNSISINSWQFLEHLIHLMIKVLQLSNISFLYPISLIDLFIKHSCNPFDLLLNSYQWFTMFFYCCVQFANFFWLGCEFLICNLKCLLSVFNSSSECVEFFIIDTLWSWLQSFDFIHTSFDSFIEIVASISLFGNLVLQILFNSFGEKFIVISFFLNLW